MALSKLARYFELEGQVGPGSQAGMLCNHVEIATLLRDSSTTAKAPKRPVVTKDELYLEYAKAYRAYAAMSLEHRMVAEWRYNGLKPKTKKPFSEETLNYLNEIADEAERAYSKNLSRRN